MRGSMFAFASSALALGLAALSATSVASAPIVAVYLDHSTRLPLRGSVGSVIVGDPSVADAVVVDHQTVYVQGKNFGETEIVVLDTAGQSLWQGDVAVVSPERGRVTLVRGTQVNEMTCAGICASVIKAVAVQPADSSK